ncbi:MAG: uroporphyrinogen-III decarboxylase [Phycisphaerae bacterium]|nr:uroporphyrinogen-III decarboxylase [Phycisphaerae bacterium]
MNSRQRVLAALNHQQPDRVPMFYRDVPEVRTRLLKDLNIANFDALLEHFEIDFRWVQPAYIGPKLESDNPNFKKDIWGVEYKFVSFSKTGGYWEVSSNPLADITDPAALKNFPWPKTDWYDFDIIPELCKKYDDYAIMTCPGIASPSIFQSPIQTLIGEERSFMALMLEPDFIDTLIEHILEFQLAYIEKFFKAANGRIDFFRIGDDYGTQRGLLMSPRVWRKRIQPGLMKMAELAKSFGAHYYHHSCGAIRQLIPDLIETGVEVLDPIQVSATDMIPAELKAEFGDKLCFSGGVDENELLTKGTPEQVKQGVKKLMDAMAPGGGFFVGPTHNFQDDIPTENIVAMYQAARTWKY